MIPLRSVLMMKVEREEVSFCCRWFESKNIKGIRPSISGLASASSTWSEEFVQSDGDYEGDHLCEINHY